MRRWIILFVAGLLGLPLLLRTISLDDSFVVLVFGETTAQMPLWFWIAAMALANLLLFFMVRALRAVWLTPQNMSRWFDRRAQNRMQNLTVRGFLSLLEHNWTSAARDLQKSAEKSDVAVINYLLAAQARFENGDLSGAESLLRKAEQVAPEAHVAVGIRHVQWLQQSGRHDQAHELLKLLVGEQPRHALLQKMLVNSYSHRGNGSKVLSLLLPLQKQKIVAGAELEQLTQTACLQALAQVEAQPDVAGGVAAALHKRWQSFPALAQNDTVVIAAFCRSLMRAGDHQGAEELLRRTLQKYWQSELVLLYGQLSLQDGRKCCEAVDLWRSQHPQDVDLLLTAARLYARHQQAEKAESCYDQYSAVVQDPAAMFEWACLLSQLGRHDKIATLREKLPA